MTNSYVFGKTIKRRFYPQINGEPIQLPSQTPTIYIFDSEPTREAAIAGTGAIDTVATWAQATVSPFECTYDIAAIDDPDPDSNTENAVYWEAIKFIGQTSEQTQTVVRAFILERIEGNEAEPGTTAGDILAVYPAIEAYLTPEQLGAHLRLAQDELKIDLEALGLKWGRLRDLNKLKLALAWKSIQLSAESQIKNADDKFDKRADLYREKYERALKNISLPYDSDGDGKAEVTSAPQSSSFLVTR